MMKELKATDPAGTEGVYGGRPAMRVDLDDKPYVIATRNEGARSRTGYGKHYTFDESTQEFCRIRKRLDGRYHILRTKKGEWHTPYLGEWQEFVKIPNSWERRGKVSGRSFTVAEGKTVFLPAAGYVSLSDRSLCYRGENGYYWSSTPDDSFSAYGLDFLSGDCGVSNNYRGYGGSVRLFCELPSE